MWQQESLTAATESARSVATLCHCIRGRNGRATHPRFTALADGIPSQPRSGRLCVARSRAPWIHIPRRLGCLVQPAGLAQDARIWGAQAEA